MVAEFAKQISQTLEEIKSQGLFKTERIITSPQDAHIRVADGREVLNMCANNYLGLADHPELIKAAKAALDTHGLGMASVRFICGTQDLHKQLEAALTKFLGTEDTILYPSAFDANGGFFETILSEKDAVISDELNHASIIVSALYFSARSTIDFRSAIVPSIEKQPSVAINLKRALLASFSLASRSAMSLCL